MNPVTRLFQWSKQSDPKQLEKILINKPFFEPVLDQDGNFKYAVAHGEIRQGEKVSPIRTAVKIRQNRLNNAEVEFSSNVAELPDNRLGLGIVNQLNEVLEPKLIARKPPDIPYVPKTRKLNLLAVTNQPLSYILEDPETRIFAQLKIHADTQLISESVLNDPMVNQTIDPQLPDDAVNNLACQIVTNRFQSLKKFQESFTPHYYLPKSYRQED